jgi:hypothetical protein
MFRFQFSIDRDECFETFLGVLEERFAFASTPPALSHGLNSVPGKCLFEPRGDALI